MDDEDPPPSYEEVMGLGRRESNRHQPPSQPQHMQRSHITISGKRNPSSSYIWHRSLHKFYFFDKLEGYMFLRF
jgi:hypothetical protein